MAGPQLRNLLASSAQVHFAAATELFLRVVGRRRRAMRFPVPLRRIGGTSDNAPTAASIIPNATKSGLISSASFDSYLFIESTCLGPKHDPSAPLAGLQRRTRKRACFTEFAFRNPTTRVSTFSSSRRRMPAGSRSEWPAVEAVAPCTWSTCAKWRRRIVELATTACAEN
jgi:hypothetical protein